MVWSIFLVELCVAAVPLGLKALQEGINAQYKKNYEKALEYYTQAIDSGELSKESLALAYNNRADAWVATAHYYKALIDYNEAIKLDPRASYFNRRGILAAKLEQYDKAIKDYSESIKRDKTKA